MVGVAAPDREPDPAAADALRDRELRIGDAFAMPHQVVAALIESGGQEAWLRAAEGVSVYDISYEARAAAKLAGAAAVAPPLSHEEAGHFLREDEDGGAAAGPPEQVH